MTKKRLRSYFQQKAVNNRNENCKPSVRGIRLTVPEQMESKGIPYSEAIKTLAETSDPEIFDNSGPDHATTVMSNIFRTSKNHVRIFAGDLGGNVSKGEYLIELERYLDKGNKLSIVLENRPKRGNGDQKTAFDIIEKYNKINPNKVFIGYLNQNSPYKNLGIHFTIGDERMYRLETDTNLYTARCSFNDPDFAFQLLEIFNTLAK